MKSSIANLIAVLALLFSNTSVAAVEAGKDYKLLASTQPAPSGPIEVLDFFSYACSHCYHLHQSMAPWASAVPNDVKLTHVPVIFTESWAPMARMYHTLHKLGQADALHDEIYKEVHVRHLDLANQLSTKPSRLDFMQFLGVDANQFTAAYDSPEVESKLAEAGKLQERYQIRGTPTLIVDGRYLISGLTPEQTMQVLPEVIELARKSRPVAAPKTVTPEVAPATAPPEIKPQPGMSASTSRVPAKTKGARSKNLDLRHCLELGSNAEIAKCAGE